MVLQLWRWQYVDCDLLYLETVLREYQFIRCCWRYSGEKEQKRRASQTLQRFHPSQMEKLTEEFDKSDALCTFKAEHLAKITGLMRHQAQTWHHTSHYCSSKLSVLELTAWINIIAEEEAKGIYTASRLFQSSLFPLSYSYKCVVYVFSHECPLYDFNPGFIHLKLHWKHSNPKTLHQKIISPQDSSSAKEKPYIWKTEVIGTFQGNEGNGESSHVSVSLPFN